MKIFYHAANSLEQIKECNSSKEFDGLEIDFQLCDNHLVNTHNFFKGLPSKKNWLFKKSYQDLLIDQKAGKYLDMTTVISTINKDKTVIIDMKNWFIKIMGWFYNNRSEYLHDKKMLANLFWDYMTKFKNQDNILVQSYDHDLVLNIMRIAKARKINNHFKYGLIIRTKSQLQNAINYTKNNDIDFLAIRYLALKKFGGCNKLLKIVSKPVKIYCWFDMDDFYLSMPKRDTLIKKINCDGYIK